MCVRDRSSRLNAQGPRISSKITHGRIIEGSVMYSIIFIAVLRGWNRFYPSTSSSMEFLFFFLNEEKIHKQQKINLNLLSVFLNYSVLFLGGKYVIKYLDLYSLKPL
jgi:hypothetical protein